MILSCHSLGRPSQRDASTGHNSDGAKSDHDLASNNDHPVGVGHFGAKQALPQPDGERKMRYILSVASIAIVTGSVSATPLTGHDVASLCHNPDTETCDMYVQGLYDGLSGGAVICLSNLLFIGAHSDARPATQDICPIVCAPEGTTPDQLKQVLLQFIRDHPEELDGYVGTLFTFALGDVGWYGHSCLPPQ